MELHIEQAYRSHINQKSLENPRNEIHFSIDRLPQRLSTSGVNDSDIDLPAYHEIYNNDGSI